MYRHPCVRLAVRDEQRHMDLVRTVQRRDAFQECSDGRIRLVPVFETSVCATHGGRVLEERDPVRNPKVGHAASELGGVVREGCLGWARLDGMRHHG